MTQTNYQLKRGQMFTVALIGPDGVGKTTIAKMLEASFQLPIKYVYMGFNAQSANYMLPTTRWWEAKKAKQKSNTAADNVKLDRPLPQANGNMHPAQTPLHSPITSGWHTLKRCVKRACNPVVKGLGFFNRIGEEWYRQLIGWFYKKRGYIIIFDRHFIYDYYHRGIEANDNNNDIKQKLHSLFLKHVLQEPDLVICLDAPGKVVFQRKGEFTPKVLETKRAQYLALKEVAKNFAVVNADRNLNLVIKEVSDLIHQYSLVRRDARQKKYE